MANPPPATDHAQSPTELNELRESVEKWLGRAAKALLSFRQDDGTFLLSNKKQEADGEPFNTTTTARAYKAMVSTTWRMDGEKALNDPLSKLSRKEVHEDFEKLFKSPPYFVWKDSVTRLERFVVWPEPSGAKISEATFEKCTLNNFDVAHLTDYVHALHYLQTYLEPLLGKPLLDPNKLYRAADGTTKSSNEYTIAGDPKIAGLSRLRDSIVNMLTLASADKHHKHCGRVPLVRDEKETRHFFVTLHALRALSILDACSAGKSGTEPLPPENEENIVRACAQFCIEQCFLASRGGRHEFDCTSLTFALVIYVTYSQSCDKDLVSACLDAICAAQNTDGSWPATHPIIRGGSKPWHITSHELALSLSWLYFQPRVTEGGRLTVLRMLERYFRNWVMKTHVDVQGEDPIKRYSGWFDDHTITRDFAAGWVTAIVCDFLGNYHNILCDYTNRRVIETLGIETSADDYLINEDVPKPAEKWRFDISQKEKVWPDLPPLSWPKESLEEEAFANRIAKKWTDPQRDSESTGIAVGLSKLLCPVVNKPAPKLPDDVRLFLLPGPPGTRKTSLVKSIPSIARWPLITVPAATFFEDGFDHLLTRATYVFRSLGYLRNCVIFFDEFEEFFRERFGEGARGNAVDKVIDEVLHRVYFDDDACKKIAQMRNAQSGSTADREFHDRTIAAFITSSMLPHLQILHDDGRCFVFVATNSEATIDRAIQRPGRFDFRIEVPHPNLKCVDFFLKSKPSDKGLEKLGIPVPDNGNEWDELATELRDLLRDPNWRISIVTALLEDLKWLIRIAPEKKAVLQFVVAQLQPVAKTLKCYSPTVGGASGVDAILRVPFRNIDEALKEIRLEMKRGATATSDTVQKALTRRLDDRVLDLPVNGK